MEFKGRFLCTREAIKNMMKNGTNGQGKLTKSIQISTP
jgi:hypothetical protein